MKVYVQIYVVLHKHQTEEAKRPAAAADDLMVNVIDLNARKGKKGRWWSDGRKKGVQGDIKRVEEQKEKRKKRNWLYLVLAPDSVGEARWGGG